MTLSDPEGQSCASCHGPEVGWTGPDEEVNKAGSVYPGALHRRYGNRKPNSAAYATLSPLFHQNALGRVYVVTKQDVYLHPEQRSLLNNQIRSCFYPCITLLIPDHHFTMKRIFELRT